MNKEKIMLLGKIILGLIILQAIRATLVLTIFHFTDRTLLTDTIAVALLMTVMTIIGIIIAKRKGISLAVLPSNRKIMYGIATVIILILIIFTPFITGYKSLFAVSSLVSSTLITPIFEELIFRGYVWIKLEEKSGGRLAAYIFTTLLFAVWHIGYIDNIAYRAGLNNLSFIMLMKVVTGLCFGIILGAVRYKSRNCFSTILLHSVMNMFGR